MTETVRDQYVSSTKRQWVDLVRLALRMPPDRLTEVSNDLAKKTGATPAHLRRKIEAVLHAKFSGSSEEQILMMGQKQVLSRYALHRSAKKNGVYRIMRWKVLSDIADRIQPGRNPAETLQERLVRVCHIQSSDEFWEFIDSCFADLHDVELRNLHGSVSEKEVRQCRSQWKKSLQSKT